MKRDFYGKLMAWRSSDRRKPLILKGARQVGKTWLLREFGKKEYPDTAYFNFEEDPELGSLFEKKLEPASLVQKLSLYRNKKIECSETLIIFDEVQQCSNALTSLKYFAEQAPDFHLIAAGSLLGIKLNPKNSFPVGKVNFLELYPCTFLEFLDAVGKSGLRQYLEALAAFEPLEGAFHSELIELLRIYFFVGGMPEAVVQYVHDNDFDKVREVHREILNSYALDFAKHAPPADAIKITAVWDSIPHQLARENKKFIFSSVKQGARAREYESAIQWLVDSGLIAKSYQVSTPKIPPSGYAKSSIYKTYLLDVGLLASMARIPAQTLIKGDQLFTEFKGAFTENFVAQQLWAAHGTPLYYWSSEGIAELDFLVEHEGKIFPLEVKAGESRKTRSLRVYGQNFHPPILSRATMRNLKKDGDVCNYPLYLVSRFPALFAKYHS